MEFSFGNEPVYEPSTQITGFMCTFLIVTTRLQHASFSLVFSCLIGGPGGISDYFNPVQLTANGPDFIAGEGGKGRGERRRKP